MPTVYSPPVSTYVPLATYTVTGSPDAEVEFSSIPATYRDLIVVINGTSTANATMQTELNGETGSLYSWVFATGPLESDGGAGKVIGRMETTTCTNIIQIMDYSATDKHKTMLFRTNTGGSQVWMGANRFASTSAVTSVKFFVPTTTFAVGATFSLFGVAA